MFVCVECCLFISFGYMLMNAYHAAVLQNFPGQNSHVYVCFCRWLLLVCCSWGVCMRDMLSCHGYMIYSIWKLLDWMLNIEVECMPCCCVWIINAVRVFVLLLLPMLWFSLLLSIWCYFVWLHEKQCLGHTVRNPRVFPKPENLNFWLCTVPLAESQ